MKERPESLTAINIFDFLTCKDSGLARAKSCLFCLNIQLKDVEYGEHYFAETKRNEHRKLIRGISYFNDSTVWIPKRFFKPLR